MAKVLETTDEPRLRTFFQSNKHYLPGLDEIAQMYPEQELQHSLQIADRCESPSVTGEPLFPDFRPPNGESCESYFRSQCREGWRQKIEPILKAIPVEQRQATRKVYGDRAKHELDILCEAGLSPYFLSVQDFVRFARYTLKKKLGPARGSAAGCLVSFLLDVTRVNPIVHGLLFERFWNAARKGQVPDIDCDFEVSAREPVVNYLRDKYGPDKVIHMGTFSRLKGKVTLRDILRIHSRCGFEEAGRITEPIPDEAAITDDLEVMRQESGGSSIIRWALLNQAEALREWCWLSESGELDGPLACDFAQAIRLEGSIRNMGRHASGVIVSPIPVTDRVPLVLGKCDDEDSIVTAWEMGDVEKAGLTKMDVLGVAALSRLSILEQLVRTGSAR